MDGPTTFTYLTDLHVGTADDSHLFGDTTQTLEAVLTLVTRASARTRSASTGRPATARRRTCATRRSRASCA